MHEHIDSFGALPYVDGGVDRIQNKTGGKAEEGMGCACVVGCAAAPWTGSLVLKQSSLEFCSECDEELDMNAPPDLFATLADGVDRRLRNLQDLLKPMKRLFVCGLALDFCCLDTCLNGRLLGFEQVFMVLDAARPAHLAGVGTYGSGFLQDPKGVLEKMKKADVKVLSALAIGAGARLGSGTSSDNLLKVFPQALLPIELSSAKLKVKLDASGGTYTVLLEGQIFNELKALDFANIGKCSPFFDAPVDWEAPKGAVRMCWAYPMEGTRALAERSQLSFLSISTSSELRFAAYGGFLFCDKDNNVVRPSAPDEGGRPSRPPGRRAPPLAESSPVRGPAPLATRADHAPPPSRPARRSACSPSIRGSMAARSSCRSAHPESGATSSRRSSVSRAASSR